MTPIRASKKEELRLTNLEKVLWEEESITKGEVLKYFSDVAPLMLPHLKDRPLVLTRYPDGTKSKGFYQKQLPAHAPKWLKRASLPSEKRVIDYLLVEDTPDLLWAVNQGAFEIHCFLSRIESIDTPDYAVFDLDPMEETTWFDVRQAALAVKAALNHFGLRGYPKTSGGEGLQVFLPLVNRFTYSEVREFAEGLCHAIGQLLPETTTLVRKPSLREGKLYLDYLQNVKGKTLVAAYAVRPRRNAPVSTPITWQEVEQDLVDNNTLTLRSVANRFQVRGDLFADVLRDKQDITGPLNTLRKGV